MLLPLSALAGDAIGRLPAPRQRPVTVAAVALFGLLLPWLLTGGLDPAQPGRPPSPNLAAAARTLRAVVPPGGRHLLADPSPFTDLGTSSPERYLAVASGTDSAHLYFPEATDQPGAGLIPGRFLRTLVAADALGRLRRSGITNVVVSDAYQRQELLGAGGYRPVDRHGDVTTFAVEPEPDAPDVGQLLQPDGDLPRPIGSRLRARAAQVRPEELRWSTDAARPVAVVAPVAYDPGWGVTVDGRDMATRRSNDGLVRFALPAGTHRVRLRFTGSANLPVGIALTVGGLVGAAWVLRPRPRLARGRRCEPVSPGRRHPRSTGRGGRRGDRPARRG